MAAKLQTTVQTLEGATFVELAGVIDEDNDLSGLVHRIVGQTALLHLGRIERINSCGVRDWVNWLGDAEARNIHVILVACAPAIVAQINLVRNFTGGGAVKSFYAPYFCPRCDTEKALLLDAATFVGEKEIKAPTCRCDECDGMMDFDDLEESYFAFLQDPNRVCNDAGVDALLATFQPQEPKEASEHRLRPRTGQTPVTPSAPSASSAPSSSGPISATGVTPRSQLIGLPQPLPNNSSAKWPAIHVPSEPASIRNAPPPPSSRGAWLLVAVLLVTAAGLALYVLFAPRA